MTAGLVSVCCCAPVTVLGDTTQWHACNGCGKPCDAHPLTRHADHDPDIVCFPQGDGTCKPMDEVRAARLKRLLDQEAPGWRERAIRDRESTGDHETG